MLCASALLLALDFALNKLYQQKAGTSIRAGLGFNTLLGGICALIFFAVGGFSIKITWYSLAMSAGMATLIMLYNLIGFRIMKMGSMAIYTLFLMTGGMTLPYLWGLFFLDEPFSWLRTAGLCVLMGAVLLSNLPRRGEKLNAKLLLMCIGIFVLNGCVSIISKMHQIEASYPVVDTTCFVMLSGIAKFAISGTAYLIAKRAGNAKNESNDKRSMLPIAALILCSAIIGGVSYLFQLMGAKNLPATVLYPFITGGSMVFSSIVGIVAFREKPSKLLLFSIGACFVGTLMFL